MTSAEEPAPITPEAIDALVRFLPMFEAPGFKAGEWHGGEADADGIIHMPWFELNEEAMAFLAELGRYGWVFPFNWRAWEEEAVPLVDGDGLEHADVATIRRLFTLLVRSDRFIEGQLGWAMESGLIVRMLRRLREIAP